MDPLENLCNPAPRFAHSPVMTTTPEVATPAKRPLKPSTQATAKESRLSLLQLVGVCVALGVLGFNAWWYWRDTRPLPDLAAISGLMSRDQYAEAERALREYLRRSPHNGEARMMLARVYASSRQPRKLRPSIARSPLLVAAESRGALSRGAVLSHDRPCQGRGAGMARGDKGRSSASRLAGRVSRHLPGIAQALRHSGPLGRCPSGHLDGLRPCSRIGKIELADYADACRVRAGRAKARVEQLRHYVAAAPDDWESLRALAHAELVLGERALAQNHFEKCVAGRPDDVRAWRDYLGVLLEQGELERFLDLLHAPPPSADTEPETWFFRGVASEKSADWKTAAAHFTKAVNLNPFLAKAYYRLGAAEGRLGLRDLAIIHRKKSKEINEARGQFPAAYSGYLSSLDSSRPGSLAPATAARRVAAMCETLGWLRGGQRLANSWRSRPERLSARNGRANLRVSLFAGSMVKQKRRAVDERPGDILGGSKPPRGRLLHAHFQIMPQAQEHPVRLDRPLGKLELLA